MSIPEFTAESSLYRTSNRYRSSVADFGDSIADQSVVAAYIPGPRTQERCSGCTDPCVGLRDICLAKVALGVLEGCAGTLGFGCGAAIAWGYVQTAGCYAHYAECFGLCQIPSNPLWESPCCPKVCGIHIPGIAGSGCCDHGETCKGLGMQENTRDGCCPVGRDCGSVCCAAGENCCGEICCPSNYFCIDSNTCVEYPTFPNTPPPPRPESGCYLFEGGSPCGSKCCYGGLQCCGVLENGQPDCKTSCLR
jgi:hypothetical protein